RQRRGPGGAGGGELRRPRLPPGDGPDRGGGGRRGDRQGAGLGRRPPVRPRDPLWPTAADWLRQGTEKAPAETELAVLGVPLSVLLGGDNAVTYPAMLGMAGDGIEGWGLVTLDAHHDVRTYEGRPGNGSPVRALIDAGLPGNQVVQVGIAGFANSVAYRRWCDDVGIDVVTAAEVRFGSIEDVLVEAFDRLALSVD